MTVPPLRDRVVLVVEDEYYLAMELERDLIAAGASVLGPVPSVAQALATIESGARIDIAVLDINLGGEMSYPVADALLERGLRFVITTGYVDGDLDVRYPGIPRCEKPIQARDLLETLRTALG